MQTYLKKTTLAVLPLAGMLFTTPIVSAHDEYQEHRDEHQSLNAEHRAEHQDLNAEHQAEHQDLNAQHQDYHDFNN